MQIGQHLKRQRALRADGSRAKDHPDGWNVKVDVVRLPALGSTSGVETGILDCGMRLETDLPVPEDWDHERGHITGDSFQQ